ncbi:alpha/beta hydrolase [Streptomyces sp. N50]|uniref:alpha/beta hydrolase n=1 Tax=Streptomyces sp. N50 TaxID=3081765 RepID=UPI00296251C2|nr:alpha/beta hydrolase [Streptomyces sp. N50]WOX15176.1 alpha/beta hydrolase [Streptomyces sp. N50]
MKLDAVDPELRRAVARMPRLPVRRTWGRRVVRALVVRHGPGDPVEGVDVRVLDEGPGLRVYTPAGGGSGAALLWVHGGGYVIGDVVQDNAFCALTARESDIVVVSANYRLAPEHPFPAALDDLSAAWRRVRESAGSLGVDPARVAVGGASAGAGLAACLAQRLYDAGGIPPVGQWLFSPMLDDRTAARRELDGVRHRVWHNAANRTGWAAYLGTGPGASLVPDHAVAARRADLGGLPPAWIGVGDIDLFADECRTYADRLRDAGVDCAFDLVPGAPHGFETWAPGTRIARALLERGRAWLRARVAGPASTALGEA